MAQTFETWTDETAARDVVYDKTKTNFETIRSSWSGTSFPENPVVGQPCYRTDEDKLYYWNGTEWGEKGGGASVKDDIDSLKANKANVDLSNLDATGQAKFDAKADKNIPVIGIPATSGTVYLADNTIYIGTMNAAMTFVLPAVSDATIYHQIKAMLYLPVVTIDWGTTHYIGGEVPDVSEAGQYMIYWDYVPALSAWAVGAMKVR